MSIILKENNMEEAMTGALGVLAIGIGYVAILSPAIIIWVVFHYVSKIQKNKNETLVNIAKEINDPEQVREIVDQLNEKKNPTDLRKGGVILIFIGFGLAGFGVLSIPILKSVGFLVSSLGIGLLVAGYIYPNESEEITKAVESFEK
jgi:Na+/proline symporter